MTETASVNQTRQPSEIFPAIQKANPLVTSLESVQIAVKRAHTCIPITPASSEEGTRQRKAAGGWKLGNHYEDRQTDMWGPVEVEGSFDNEQILAFWMRGLSRDPESPERMQEMVDTSVEHFVPLIEKLRARGGDAVFIRMPGNGKYLEHAIKTNYRELTWNPMTEGFDAVSINTMDYPELSSELEIPEWAHLSRKSQDDFSRLIVPKLKQIYVKERGHSIDDIIHRRAAGE